MKKTVSGIRGIFGKDLCLKDVLEFANNFSVLIRSKKCVIGNDTRPSGSMIKETAKAALMKNGIDVFDLGVVPTPVVFREARKYGSGLIISSSHNPIEWNGMKFIIDGRGINEMELPYIVEHQKNSLSSIGNECEISSSYIEDAEKILGKVDSQLKVAIDIGGGATNKVAPTLLGKIGCKVTAINEELEGSSRGPDPTVDRLVDLCEVSKKNRLGFAFDLDGDRLVVVKDGKKQSPDVTLGLGIAKSLELGCKNFVLSTDTSIAVEKLIRESGGNVQRSKVGEANVIDAMLRTDAQAGGEGGSAGFILPEFNYCREGILASGLIASMVDSSNFNEIVSYMESYSQIRVKTSVNPILHDRVIENLQSKFEKEYSETSRLDGLKGIIDEDSWILIRKSNTEDVIRVSGESKSLDRCKKIVEYGVRLVNESYKEVR